jgi:glucose-1-phosphate adenylyltransferase
MSDCDVICNVDFRDMIRDHIASGADMTLAVKRMELTAERARTGIILRSDENGRVSDCLIHPTNYTGEGDVSLNLFVLRKNYLRHIVRDAVAHGYGSMTRDVLLRNMDVACRELRMWHLLC